MVSDFSTFRLSEGLRTISLKVGSFHSSGLPLSYLCFIPSSQVNPKATISVRLAAVDAPEGAAFGSREQPYYKEAKKYLESNLLGKKVDVWPLRKDQYGRIVGMATVRDWGFRTKNISLEMVTRGLGVVYKASGAAYGGIQKDLFAAEEAAKSAKRGIWSQGDKLVLPGEHKAKTRAARESGEAEDPVEEEPKGIVSRLWGAIFGGRR
jgi:endonuclease YncB( thermonuclease family)